MDTIEEICGRILVNPSTPESVVIDKREAWHGTGNPTANDSFTGHSSPWLTRRRQHPLHQGEEFAFPKDVLRGGIDKESMAGEPIVNPNCPSVSQHKGKIGILAIVRRAPGRAVGRERSAEA